MKLVSHNGRVDVKGRHNDRNFDVSKAEHINAEKSKDNYYFTYNNSTNMTFRQLELEYYDKHFGPYIKKQNDKNIKEGHKKRNRSVKDVYESKNSRPEDKIIQIGDKDEHISAEQLWEVALEFQKRFDEMFGENCKILDMALHVDEATPHVHIRRVWKYQDEDNFEKISQNKALQEMGILNNKAGEIGKFNNSKIAFTRLERGLLLDICKEKNIELEEASSEKRPHLSVPEYKEVCDDILELKHQKKEIQMEIQEKTAQFEELFDIMEEFLRSSFFQHIFDEELEFARKKNVMERYTYIFNLYQEEIKKVIEKGSFDAILESVEDRKHIAQAEQIRKLTHKVEILSHFISDTDQAETFRDYIKNQSREEKEQEEMLQDE